MVTWRIIFALLLVTSLPACGDDNQEISEYIKSYIPDYSPFAVRLQHHPANFEIINVTLVASADIGNAVDPKVLVKIKTEVRLLDDLYTKVAFVNDIPIIAPNEDAKSGSVGIYFLKAEAWLNGESWILNNLRISHSPGDSIENGYPLAYWKEKKAALKGSALATALLEKQKREEESRAYAEQMERDVAEARYQANVAASKAKEDAFKAKRDARLVKYRQKMDGTWKVHEPVRASRLGGVYKEAGMTYRYVLTFADDDAIKGDVKITFYAIQDPEIYVNFMGKYRVTTGFGRSIYVIFDESAGHKLPTSTPHNWVSGNSWNMSFKDNGTASASGHDGKNFKLYLKR